MNKKKAFLFDQLVFQSRVFGRCFKYLFSEINLINICSGRCIYTKFFMYVFNSMCSRKCICLFHIKIVEEILSKGGPGKEKGIEKQE